MTLTQRFRTDRELQARIIGIPLVAALATLQSLTWEGHSIPLLPHYAISLAFTFSIWNGAYAIFLYARRKFPNLPDTGKRIAITLLGIMAWVLVVNVTLCWGIGQLLGLAGMERKTFFVEGLISAGTMTFIVSTVYEVVYLVRRLVAAQRQADQLTQENLVAQLSRLKTQIQPHFLFNNFNTLAAVIEENPPLASKMVQELANFYRYLLAATDRDMVPLHEELDCLKAYAFLLKMRHEDDFVLEVNVDPALMQAQVPVLSLQMLVENAVKHTAIGPGQPLKVLVEADEEEGRIWVQNVLRPRTNPLPSAGVGLENLKQRLKLAGLPEPEVIIGHGHFVVEVPLLMRQKQPINA